MIPSTFARDDLAGLDVLLVEELGEGVIAKDLGFFSRHEPIDNLGFRRNRVGKMQSKKLVDLRDIKANEVFVGDTTGSFCARSSIVGLTMFSVTNLSVA